MAVNSSKESIAVPNDSIVSLSFSEGYMDNATQETSTEAYIPELGELLKQGDPEAVIVVSLMCITGLVALVISGIVFCTTRFVRTQDRNVTIAIVANICGADFFSGLYAVAKTADFYCIKPLTNCFMYDGIFFMSLLMSSILLPILQWDSLSGLKQHLGRRKQCLVFSMVFIWDGAVIMGFVPLMGWNNWSDLERDLNKCYFFQYYTRDYLILICSVILITLTCSFGQGITMVVQRRRVKWDISEQNRVSATYLEQSQKVLNTCMYTCCCQCVCFLPFVIFVLIKCQSSSLSSDKYLLYVITAIQIKSILSPFILLRRTYPLTSVLKQKAKRGLTCLLSCCIEATEEENGIGTSIGQFTCCVEAPEEENSMRTSISHRSEVSRAQQTSISVISHEQVIHRDDCRSKRGTSYQSTEPIMSNFRYYGAAQTLPRDKDKLFDEDGYKSIQGTRSTAAKPTNSYRFYPRVQTVPRDKHAIRRDSCDSSHMCYRCGYSNPAFSRYSVGDLSSDVPSPSKNVQRESLEIPSTSNNAIVEMSAFRNQHSQTVRSDQLSVFINPSCKIHGLHADAKHVEWWCEFCARCGIKDAIPAWFLCSARTLQFVWESLFAEFCIHTTTFWHAFVWQKKICDC